MHLVLNQESVEVHRVGFESVDVDVNRVRQLGDGSCLAAAVDSDHQDDLRTRESGDLDGLGDPLGLEHLTIELTTATFNHKIKGVSTYRS